jgi:anti-anti-sigma factor
MNRDRGQPSVDAWGIKPPPFHVLRNGAASGNAPLLVLEGEFDMAAADDLRARLASIADRGAAGAVLDLSAVTFMDSSTLRELLRADLLFRGSGGRLVLAMPTPPVERLLELTHAATLLVVVDSLPEAFRQSAA